MGCSDWAEILCGNVSRVEKYALIISCDLHARFARCFRTGGGLWACRARSWDIWRPLALSKGTSLGHREIGSCLLREILYGGRLGRMRNTHKIKRRSEVVRGLNPRFEKIAKFWWLPAKFPNGMAVDGVLRLG